MLLVLNYAFLWAKLPSYALASHFLLKTYHRLCTNKAFYEYLQRPLKNNRCLNSIWIFGITVIIKPYEYTWNVTKFHEQKHSLVPNIFTSNGTCLFNIAEFQGIICVGLTQAPQDFKFGEHHKLYSSTPPTFTLNFVCLFLVILNPCIHTWF